MGEDDQASSEAQSSNSSQAQSDAQDTAPSSTTEDGQSTSETPSSTSEEPQSESEVAETQTEHGAEGTTQSATEGPQSESEAAETQSEHGGQGTSQWPPSSALTTTAPPLTATSQKSSGGKGSSTRHTVTTASAGNASEGTSTTSTSGDGELATGSTTTGHSSDTEGTTARTDAQSSSARDESVTAGSSTEPSGTSTSASSSASSSTDGCKPNANKGGDGSPIPLFDILPPGAGWLKSTIKDTLEMLGYNPDTGKEDTRPPCPSETGAEDEDEEEDDDDDDDDDDILPPGTDDTNGGGGGFIWPLPPGIGPNPFGGVGPFYRPRPSPPAKTKNAPTEPGNSQNPTPEPTSPPDPNCTPIAFEAGCVQDCTSFSYTLRNMTSTWTECGREECSVETGCEPTPALTETSWTTRTCSKTITQTDVCKQVCTEYVSPWTSTSAYTTETRCASSMTCRPTVVCEEQDPTTTTSYTTETEAPTHACYAMEEDLEARLTELQEAAGRGGNASEAGTMQRRQVNERQLLDFNRLTSPNDAGWGLDEWHRKWRDELATKGVGSPSMAFAQYMDDDFLPNHAVYMPLRDVPAATGVRNMAGCSAVVIASPHGVYVAHFWQVPTFRPPGPDVVARPLRFDYSDRAATFERRVIDFLRHGNFRWRVDQGVMTPDFNSPASPSLEDLAAPNGPFHDIKSMDWYFVAFINPREHGKNYYADRVARLKWRDAIRRVLSPDNDLEYLRVSSVEQISYGVIPGAVSASNDDIQRHFDNHPQKNALVVQYAPAVPNPNNPIGAPSRQLRIWWSGKPIFSKSWCAPPAAAMLPLPPNLPVNSGPIYLPALPAPPGELLLAARQEGGESEDSEMEPAACPAQPWKVCAVDVAQTVVPTMGPSIQGTIDVTDEQGLRAHLENFRDIPFGGFVSSEPEDNHLGYNVTMRFEGDWDNFLLDKGYACNCTDDGCDLYSAQCCRRNDCPKCDCADGVCQAGSPACCQDNSCNVTRPREPTDYPFKTWDVKVAIEGEKGALQDEPAWAKNVSCTASEWDYLNETVVDGYCMAVSLSTPPMECERSGEANCDTAPAHEVHLGMRPVSRRRLRELPRVDG